MTLGINSTNLLAVGNASRTSQIFTPSGVSAGAMMLVFFFSSGSSNPGGTGVSDNESNSWSKLASSTSGTGRYVELWGSPDVTPPTFVECVNTSGTVGWQLLEVDGVVASPVDVVAALAGSSASTTSPCNIIPTEDDEYIISLITANTNTTSTITQSTTGYTTWSGGGTVQPAGNIAVSTNRPLGTATGVTWSLGTAQGYGQVAIALKPSSTLYMGHYYNGSAWVPAVTEHF